MMAVRIPVQPSAGKVENSIEGLSGSRVGVEHQLSGEVGSIGSKYHVSVTSQNAHMVGMLVERVLPPALADGTDQGQFARMHMRIAVVGLMGILSRKVGVHEIGHRAAVNQEVGWMVGLRRDTESATGSGHSLFERGQKC